MRLFAMPLVVFAACNVGDPGGDAGQAIDAGLLVADSGLDAGGLGDAGSALDSGVADAGSDGGFTPGRFYSFRLVYAPKPEGAFQPPPVVDLCIRQPETAPWARVYGPPGIAMGEVGRQYRVNTRGTWALKVINIDAGCDDVAVFQDMQDIPNDSLINRVTVSYIEGRTRGVRARTNFSRFDSSIVGTQDFLSLFNHAAVGPVTFSTDAGAPRLGGTPLRLDAGTVGAVEWAGTALPYRAASATSTSLFLFGDPPNVQALFCDDLAAPNGVLTPCASMLRSP